MAKINENYNKLGGGYLFSEIAKRTRAFEANNPGIKVTRLGIGDTTEPLTPTVIEYIHAAVDRMGFLEGYSKEEIESSEMKRILHEAKLDKYNGYGTEQGNEILRKGIAYIYSERGASITSSEVFVSDGAKPDTGNIQSIFSLENIVAVQDPAYPVYVDTNVIAGRTGHYNQETEQYPGLVYMPCNKENNFIPEVPKKKVDLIYLCSPNNPTGAVMNNLQLQRFVDYALDNDSVIIFDAAYSDYIKSSGLPKSIYEINNATKCAIETNSFSKKAGFTGLRAGWTVVPADLKHGELNKLWNRRQGTFFNGASNIVQAGCLAVLTEKGQEEYKGLVKYYMKNAEIIKSGLEEIGLEVFGGENAPYLWIKTPNNMKSWDFFDKLLNECHVVCTPGVGFGPSGQGYVRLSAFNHRENVEKAMVNIKSKLIL